MNLEFSQTICAALKLGIMDFLGKDIAYIEHLLVSYRPTRELLDDYLLTYYQAVKLHLGAPAANVVDWLGQLVRNRSN